MKKIIIFGIIIILISLVAFGIYKFVFNKSEYEISQVNSFKFFKYNQDGKYGVIDAEGNVIIEARLSKYYNSQS